MKQIQEISHQTFLETYGSPSVRTSPVKKDEMEKKHPVIMKLARGASKKIRSVSLKRRTFPHKNSLTQTMSAPGTPVVRHRLLSGEEKLSLKDKKEKLLQEVLAQQDQLLKEQKVLDELIKNKRSNTSTSSSNCSLPLSDYGYFSTFDDEDDTVTSKTRSTSTSTYCSEISEDILAEIEDFENFIKSKN